MELYIHYTELPHDLPLTELEDERVIPKYAQMAVKAYLQRAGFARDTVIEIGGMEIGLYE